MKEDKNDFIFQAKQVYFPLHQGDGDDGGVQLYDIGQIIREDASKAVIRTRDGSEITLWQEDVCPFSKDAAEGIEDMCALDVLNVASLLTNVASRFAKQQIYVK